MVLAIVDDLMFRSKIRAAGDAAGAELVFARGGDAALAAVRDRQPELVIIDLDSTGIDAVATVRAIRAERPDALRIVGYGAHVNVDRLQAARDAGCDQALARSAFVTLLPTLIAGSPAKAR